MVRKYPDPVFTAYSQKGKALGLASAGNLQIYLFNALALNNSGSAATVGILRSLTSSNYKLFRYTAVGSVYTNITANIAAGTNIFSTTNGDGFVYQSQRRTGLLGVTVSSAGSAGTFTYSYWNGSSFSALTTLENPANYATTGDKYIVFQPPQDWVIGGPSGVDQTKYSIRVLGTTAPGSAVAITALWAGEFLALYQGVANNAGVQLSFPDSKPMVLNGGEGLFPYFSGANSANAFSAYFATS